MSTTKGLSQKERHERGRFLAEERKRSDVPTDETFEL